MERNLVCEGLDKLETTLRTITNVSGGAVPFKDMAFFEHINLDTGCIYHAGKVMGSDGEYVLGVFGAKVEKEILPDKPKEETGIYGCCYQSGGQDKCPIHGKPPEKVELPEEITSDYLFSNLPSEVGINIILANRFKDKFNALRNYLKSKQERER